MFAERPLRILHLEDDLDFCLVVRELMAEEGWAVEVVAVTDRAGFESALATGGFDVILGDFTLPDYSGLQALATARERAAQTPFLMVSGTIGEEAAIEALRAGATDYVLKQWLNELLPCIRRAVEAAQEKERRQKAEAELVRTQRALCNLGRRLSSVRGPHGAAEIIRDVADQLFAWDVFILDLLGDEPNQTRPILNLDTIAGQRVVVESPGGVHATSALAKRIIQNGAERILQAEPVRFQPDARPFGDPGHPSASLLFAPIRSREKVLGLLSVQSYALNAYSERELETLQVLADHCGGALERIEAEEALHASEARFREIFDNSPDAIFVENFAGSVLDVNPAGCRLHGLTRAELLGRNVAELVPEERRGDLPRDFQGLLEGVVSCLEAESLAADGRIIPVEIRVTRIEYNGQPALLLHVRDVSERKRTESALRSSEMLFHSVWENSVDGMRLTDEQGRIVAVNEAFCRLVGLRRSELEGQLFTVSYADTEQTGRLLQEYQRDFHQRTIERKTERKLTLRQGRSAVLEATHSFVELRGQPPLLLGLFRDVTLQRGLEDQLRQSQKMDAIGQLAGGVAHDFNNILTVIQGHASLLQADPDLGENAVKSAQQIVQAAERAAGLTRQLLTFGRRQLMQLRPLDLNGVVANMTKMLSRILGEDIALQMSYWPDPPRTSADASMMEQVLLNLAVNSRDAMPDGGQLSIRISVEDIQAHPDNPFADARPGRFVCLTVSDTGCGIPPENLRRIFEPFFTTKEVGKGTGLGLATVYGIVKQHQGWIEAESQVGRGTTFRVYLPATADGTVRPEERVPELMVRGGHETLLVVEDEQQVRELVCSLLQAHGYTILAADSGARALEVWRRHKHEITLLLTDVVMPDRLSGRELAEQLWAEQPSLKVIFTSGYSPEVAGKDWILRRGSTFVQKPYHPRQLALAVRECLDADDLTPAV